MKEQYCYQWEEWVTEILSDIDVKVTNNDIEDCHRIGKKNKGINNTITRFAQINHAKKSLFNKKKLSQNHKN